MVCNMFWLKNIMTGPRYFSRTTIHKMKKTKKRMRRHQMMMEAMKSKRTHLQTKITRHEYAHLLLAHPSYKMPFMPSPNAQRQSHSMLYFEASWWTVAMLVFLHFYTCSNGTSWHGASLLAATAAGKSHGFA